MKFQSFRVRLNVDGNQDNIFDYLRGCMGSRIEEISMKECGDLTGSSIATKLLQGKQFQKLHISFERDFNDDNL